MRVTKIEGLGGKLLMKNMFRALLFITAAALSACVGTGTVEERQRTILDMREEVLAELYRIKPDVRGQLDRAAGYAVFTNANVNLLFASFGGGYGVVRNNQSGRDSYMKMGELGFGIGAGIKDFRVVMVFHNQDALQRFDEYGLALSAQADAAAVAGRQGAAVGGEATADNITVYQFTKSGLALQALIKGAKFWQDEELN